MANSGQAVLAIGGAVIGGFLGGPVGAARGYFIGSAIGAAAFPVTNKVEGPRIDDPKIPGTEPGRPIPWIQGRARLTPDFLWKSAVRTITTTTTEGGKGGGPEVETRTYSYEVDLFFLLTDNIGLPNGETAGVTRVWYNKKLVWLNLSVAAQAALTGDNPADPAFIARAEANVQAAANTELWSRMTVYTGGADQLPDPDYEAAVTTALAPAHRNRTSVFIKSFQLGGSPNLGLFECEVCTKGTSGEVGGPSTMVVNLGGNPAELSNETRTYTFNPSFSTFGGAALRNTVAWTGKRYIEFALTGTAANNYYLGVIGQSSLYPQNPGGNQEHLIVKGGFGGSVTGTLENGVDISVPAYAFTTGDVIGMAVDYDTGEVRCYKNGTAFNLGNAIFTLPHAAFDPYFACYNQFSNFIVTVNLTAAQFAHTPPTGYIGYPESSAATLTPEDEDVDDVVSRICQRGDGLTAAQFDVTDIGNITDPVRSLWMTQVAPPRATLEMLADLYHFGCTLSDKLYFPRRGQASVASIAWDDLGAAMAGSEQPERLAFRLGSELEQPAFRALAFADIDNDYQTDVQPFDRLLTAMQSVQTVSAPMGFTKAEAKAIVDAWGFDQLAGALTTTLYLDGRYARLEPTDCIDVADEDGVAHRLRLLDRTDTWPLLVFSARRDDASVFDSAGITSSTIGSTIDVAAAVNTAMELLDAPLLADAYDGPHILAAAKGSDSPWPGAAIMRSNDDVEYQRVASITESAVIGISTTALGDWTGPHVFDEMNSVTVSVGEGTLASTTRAAMLADRTVNAFALIKSDGTMECGQFRTATLISTGTYTLTGLLRGLRGTEHAMTGHGDSETFVLLSTTGLRRIEMQSNQLAVAKYYKGVTFGRALSTATAESFTANGVALKPFAPTHLKALTQSNGDVALSWLRRSRLAVRGISTLGQSIPLGEETEEYKLEIFDTSDLNTVVRTVTGITSPSYTYTAAMQAADSLTPGGITYRVYQISAVVDAGYELEKAA